MEQLLTNVLTQFPNLAVAIVMLYWQKMTIEKLLETQTKLIDRLLSYVDNDKAAIRAQASITRIDQPGSRAAGD